MGVFVDFQNLLKLSKQNHPLLVTSPNSKIMCSLIWFRNDLRIENNRLLDKLSKLKSYKAIIIEEPLPYESIDDFILYNKLKTDYQLKSIRQFKNDLSKLGIEIEILKGDSVDLIPKYCEEHQLDRVYTSKIIDPETLKKGKKLESELAKKNIFIDFIYNNTWIPIDELPFPLRKLPTNFKAFLKEIKGLENKFFDKESLTLADERAVIGELIETVEDNNTYELKKYVYSANNSFFKFLPELTLGKVSSPALLDWVSEKYHNNPKKDKIIKTFKQQLLMYEHLKLSFLADPEFEFDKPAINKEPDIKQFQKWVRGETRSSLINAIMKKLASSSEISLTSKKLTIDYYVHELKLPSFWGYWYFKKQLMEYSSEMSAFLWKESIQSKYETNELHTKICALSTKLDPKNNFTTYWSNL